MNISANEEKTVSIQSLSYARLIEILQFNDGDDALTLVVEAELARRKKEGARQ
jgi:hypothetical protein